MELKASKEDGDPELEVAKELVEEILNENTADLLKKAEAKLRDAEARRDAVEELKETEDEEGAGM